MYFWKELDDCKITFITWTFLFWYFIVEYIDRYIFYLFFFKDSYTCEFSKENCTMEQLNNKTIKWVYLKANYRFSKYWNNRIYHVRFSKNGYALTILLYRISLYFGGTQLLRIRLTWYTIILGGYNLGEVNPFPFVKILLYIYW